MVNRIFLEKMVLALINKVSVIVLRAFRKLHSSKFGGAIAVVAILTAMLLYAYFMTGETM